MSDIEGLQAEFYIMVAMEDDNTATILVRCNMENPPLILWRSAAEYLLYTVAKKMGKRDLKEALCDLCEGAMECSAEVIPNRILEIKRKMTEDQE